MEDLWTCWKQSRAAVRRNKCVSLLVDGKHLAFSWTSPRFGHSHRWTVLPGVLLACPPTRLSCPELPKPCFQGVFICSGQIWNLYMGGGRFWGSFPSQNSISPPQIIPIAFVFIPLTVWLKVTAEKWLHWKISLEFFFSWGNYSNKDTGARHSKPVGKHNC